MMQKKISSFTYLNSCSVPEIYKNYLQDKWACFGSMIVNSTLLDSIRSLYQQSPYANNQGD
jgi:hypothetical protein